MRTAIFVGHDNTTLTIHTHEEVELEQMDHETKPVRLKIGANRVVVGRGVFKVHSQKSLEVTGDRDIEAVLTPDKTDPGPDPTHPSVVKFGFDAAEVRNFISDVKSFDLSQLPARAGS